MYALLCYCNRGREAREAAFFTEFCLNVTLCPFLGTSISGSPNLRSEAKGFVLGWSVCIVLQARPLRGRGRGQEVGPQQSTWLGSRMGRWEGCFMVCSEGSGRQAQPSSFLPPPQEQAWGPHQPHTLLDIRNGCPPSECLGLLPGPLWEPTWQPLECPELEGPHGGTRALPVSLHLRTFLEPECL